MIIYRYRMSSGNVHLERAVGARGEDLDMDRAEEALASLLMHQRGAPAFFIITDTDGRRRMIHTRHLVDVELAEVQDPPTT